MDTDAHRSEPKQLSASICVHPWPKMSFQHSVRATDDSGTADSIPGQVRARKKR
jgi:hypothetical protein